MTATHPRRLRRKVLIAVGGIVAIIVVAIAAYGIRKNYIYNHPLSHPEWGFQFYKPQSLPSGFKITGERIAVTSQGDVIYGVGAEMNLRTQNWVYSIRQSRHSGGSPQTKLRNFDPTSDPITCTQRTSPKKQSYRLCHWIDYEKISVYEVLFAKEETTIKAAFPTSLDKEIPLSELDSFVDSFVPADPPQDVVRGI